MKLRPESQKLLVELVKHAKVWDGYHQAYTGALAAAIGGILPEGAQTNVERCTEQDCYRARSSLLELYFWGLIYLLPADVRPVEREGQELALPKCCSPNS